MTPSTFNLFEAIVRATIKIAEAALDEETAGELRQDLGQRLTQAKVSMQRDQAEDIIQDMASVVIALSKFVLSHKPVAEPKIEKKHLQSALRDLERRYEERRAIEQAVMHPTGRCTCAGEGICEWCQTHCVHCGATEEQHKPTDDHAFESHTLSCPKCGCTDIDTQMGVCIECSYRFSYAELPPRMPQAPERCQRIYSASDPRRCTLEPYHDGPHEYEVEQAPEEPEGPVIEDKVDMGFDTERWRILLNFHGEPAIAIAKSVPDGLAHEVSDALLPIITRWISEE